MEVLKGMFSTAPVPAWALTVFLLIILCSVVWNAYDDTLVQGVVVWKLLITATLSLLLPIIFAFLFKSTKEGFYMLTSIPLYIVLVTINIKYNNNKFIGKADWDITLAWFSSTIALSLYVYQNTTSEVPVIEITTIWMTLLLYSLVGFLSGIAIFTIYFIIQAYRKQIHWKLLIKDTSVPMIPVIIIPTVMVPYMIMIF